MVFTAFKNIEFIFLDVDGVLTDGRVLVNEKGEQLRTFNVKDGYAIQYAMKAGLQVIIITGAQSLGIQKRFETLGVKEIHLGISNKDEVFEKMRAKYGFIDCACMFVGDDMPDFGCMKKAGIAICPADAVEEIKGISDYVSTKAGGDGVVRDVLEKVLKIQNKWFNDENVPSI